MGQKYEKSYAERAAAYARKKRAEATADAEKTTSAPKRNLKREVAPGLTLGQLIAETGAATKLKYGEAAQQLQAQPHRINDWYAQYRQAIGNAQSQQADNYAGAVDSVKSLQSGLDDASAKQWAGQQQAMSADAEKRGATVDPALADQAHNASNVRNALTSSYGALLVNQGAAENQYLGRRKLNSEVGRIDALKQNAQQRQNLAKERGAFKQQFRSGAIGDAVKNYLNTETALSLKAQRLASAGLSKATTEKTKAETREQELYNQYFEKYGKKPGTTLSPLEAYRLAYLKKHGYFPATGPADKGSKEGSDDEYGNTPLQQKTRTSDFRKVLRNANQVAESLRKSGAGAVPGVATATTNAKLVDKIYNAIAADYGSVNIDILRGAIQKAVYGHVGPKVGKSLTELGVDF